MFLLYLLEVYKYGFKRTTVSSFWVFTCFFGLSYPFKYFLIDHGVRYQAQVKPSEEALSIALLFSCIFWYLLYIFRPRVRNISFKIAYRNFKLKRSNTRWSLLNYLVLTLFIYISIYMFSDLLKSSAYKLGLYYIGNEQNEHRIGRGHYFYLYSLYINVFMIFVCSNIQSSKFTKSLLFAVICFIAFFNSILLGTRRPLFIAFYLILICIYINKRSNFVIFSLSLFPVFMALLSPIGQTLRYSLELILNNEISHLFNVDYILTSIGSTFEGVEHLANYINNTKIFELLCGTDFGSSWIFNMGLSNIPRLIWESKPLVYGSVSQQQYIYPHLYESGSAQLTLPSGIIVDTLFGFGIISFLFSILIISIIFNYIDRVLFRGKYFYKIELLLVVFMYIQMFNFVRGGTAIFGVVMIIILISLLFLMLSKIKIGKMVF